MINAINKLKARRQKQIQELKESIIESRKKMVHTLNIINQDYIQQHYKYDMFHLVPCSSCNGNGVQNNSACPDCSGTGYDSVSYHAYIVLTRHINELDVRLKEFYKQALESIEETYIKEYPIDVDSVIETHHPDLKKLKGELA